jgi:hypothetical protein
MVGTFDSFTQHMNIINAFKKDKKFEVPRSDCCNEPVTRIGFNFYCMQCHKACRIKDREVKGGNENGVSTN